MSRGGCLFGNVFDVVEILAGYRGKPAILGARHGVGLK
jgi:hypothetical protein